MALVLNISPTYMYTLKIKQCPSQGTLKKGGGINLAKFSLFIYIEGSKILCYSLYTVNIFGLVNHMMNPKSNQC